jgi:hypothetical protein
MQKAHKASSSSFVRIKNERTHSMKIQYCYENYYNCNLHGWQKQIFKKKNLQEWEAPWKYLFNAFILNGQFLTTT